jgi:Family of unknown function (DUF6516)
VKAELYLRRRIELGENAFAVVVIWKVPQPLRGSSHHYKYRLAYVEDGVCVIRFDNEAGKGDHIHIDNRELPYVFTSPEKLLADFEAAILGRRG